LSINPLPLPIRGSKEVAWYIDLVNPIPSEKEMGFFILIEEINIPTGWYAEPED
jgi:hypothetical protein